MSKTENNKASLCQELEACRKLKSHLIEDLRSRFPFKEQKENDVSVEKVEAYGKLVTHLQNLMKKEQGLWNEL